MTQTEDPPTASGAAQRTRTYTWQDPLIGAGAAPGLSGLDYLRGMVRGEFPRRLSGRRWASASAARRTCRRER
ncbi:hypothetical protein ACFP9V_14005 [Deinococcus radiopugnans]|uniref:hypothetical protein n=1 Tax=Deinococcus radiopugnans TaxID=57497 RepID=UPI00360B1536